MIILLQVEINDILKFELQKMWKYSNEYHIEMLNEMYE